MGLAMRHIATSFLLSIAVLSANAMDDRAPIQITGTGMQLKRSIILAVKTLKERAGQNDQNAIAALATHGETEAAVNAYNQAISMPPQPFQPQSGSLGGEYGNPFVPPQPSDSRKMPRENQAKSFEEYLDYVTRLKDQVKRGEPISEDEQHILGLFDKVQRSQQEERHPQSPQQSGNKAPPPPSDGVPPPPSDGVPPPPSDGVPPPPSTRQSGASLPFTADNLETQKQRLRKAPPVQKPQTEENSFAEELYEKFKKARGEESDSESDSDEWSD